MLGLSYSSMGGEVWHAREVAAVAGQPSRLGSPPGRCAGPLLEKRKKIVTGEQEAPPTMDEEDGEPEAAAQTAEEKPAAQQDQAGLFHIARTTLCWMLESGLSERHNMSGVDGIVPHNDNSLGSMLMLVELCWYILTRQGCAQRQAGGGAAEEAGEAPKGIPQFWLNVLRNCEEVAEHVRS